MDLDTPEQCLYFPPNWGGWGGSAPPFSEAVPPHLGGSIFGKIEVFVEIQSFYVWKLSENAKKRHFSGGACGGLGKEGFFIDFRSKSGFWHPHFSPPSGQIGGPAQCISTDAYVRISLGGRYAVLEEKKGDTRSGVYGVGIIRMHFSTKIRLKSLRNSSEIIGNQV